VLPPVRNEKKKNKELIIIIIIVVLVGRALFKFYLAPEKRVNDLYSFALGIYIMTGLSILVYWINECYTTYKETEYNQDEIMTFIKEKTKKVYNNITCDFR
jgi:membrane protein CcdC involved in cytochrome C biogenesis